MQDKKPSKTKFWSMELRIIISLTILIIPPLIAAYNLVWVSFSTLFQSGGRAQAIIALIALLAVFLASIISVIIFNLHLNKHNKYVASRLPATKLRSVRAKQANRIYIYLLIIGVALALTLLASTWPAIRSAYSTYQYEAEKQSALERGCQTYSYNELTRPTDDSALSAHLKIINHLNLNDDIDSQLQTTRAKLLSSWPNCLDKSMTPEQQQSLFSSYEQLAESYAHQILRNEDSRLEKSYIENVERVHRKYHR